ncbi:MAG TPA: ZIP family metal transporter [Candidatus Angelobacter sp.]|nr:ZIP family metal transporter [Candidatus Angelobacter sp.]
MIDYTQLLLLGAIAGLTIFLGLPMALLQNVSRMRKGFLNALAMGILVFLITDVLSAAWQPTKLAAVTSFAGRGPITDAAIDLLALFGGLGLGLLGLALYEQRYLRRIISSQKKLAVAEENSNGPGGKSSPPIPRDRMSQSHGAELFSSPHHLATMIAVGIGLHNFSEGLAIGQSYASGAIALAVVLIVGFGAHNATEGFGIAGPLTGISKKPQVSFLVKMGIIGGSPTFLGTLVGSIWVSQLTYIMFLSLAGGALIYVTLLMYNTARRESRNDLLMVGLFIGIIAGFVTDLIVTLSGA